MEAVDKETGKRHHYMEVKPADHVAYVDKSDLVVLEVGRVNQLIDWLIGWLLIDWLIG